MRATYITTTTLPKRRLDAPARRSITWLADRVRRIAQAIAQAIAAPPAHPLWDTLDARAQASFLSAAQREQLLLQGRLAPRR